MELSIKRGLVLSGNAKAVVTDTHRQEMTSAITQHNDVSTSAHGSIEARYMALRNQFAHITSVAARACPQQEALSRYVPTLYRKFGCIARLDLCGKLFCIARLLSTESHNRQRAKHNTDMQHRGYFILNVALVSTAGVRSSCTQPVSIARVHNMFR